MEKETKGSKFMLNDDGTLFETEHSIIDIKGGDLDIYVDGQSVLYISQVSDDDCINLFFYPGKNAIFIKSIISKECPDNDCKYELIVNRIWLLINIQGGEKWEKGKGLH